MNILAFQRRNPGSLKPLLSMLNSPPEILKIVTRICNYTQPSAHLSLFSLLVVFASEAKHQGCDAIRQSSSANRQFVLYLAHAVFLLSYLCYAIAQLPVEVSSGIGDDHDTQRHHRTPTMRRSCSD